MATAARCSPKATDRADLYRSLRTHGEGKTRYEVLRTGMNGRLDSIQAAVLLAKLAVFPEELQARERIARVYDQRLGNAVTTPKRVPDSTSAWAIYAILLPDEAARDRTQAALRADGVPTAIYYPRPLHRQPAYSAQHDGAALPVSEDLATPHPGAADPSGPDGRRRRADLRRRAGDGLARCACRPPWTPSNCPCSAACRRGNNAGLARHDRCQ